MNSRLLWLVVLLLALGGVLYLNRGPLRELMAPPPGGAVSRPSEAPAERAKKAFRVLFVGNSFTFTNDMPRMVADLAASANEKLRFESAMEAPGGFTLERHWKEGKARRPCTRGRGTVWCCRSRA